MSEESMKQSKPEPSAGEIEFIRDLNSRTKKSHKTTIAITIGLCALVFGYMTWLTNMTKSYLKEEYIRTLLVDYVEGQLDIHAPELIKQGKEMIPKIIQEELPRYITSKIPDIRQDVQTQADDYFTKNLEDVKPQVTAAINEYVTKYQGEIKKYSDIIQAADSANFDERKRLEALGKAKIQELADALVDNLIDVAKTREFGNPAIDRGYKNSLKRLQRINTDLTALAVTPDKDMKQEDKDLRYAVALMLDKLEWSTPNHFRSTKKKSAPDQKKKPVLAPKKK